MSESVPELLSSILEHARGKRGMTSQDRLSAIEQLAERAHAAASCPNCNDPAAEVGCMAHGSVTTTVSAVETFCFGPNSDHRPMTDAEKKAFIASLVDYWDR